MIDHRREGVSRNVSSLCLFLSFPYSLFSLFSLYRNVDSELTMTTNVELLNDMDHSLSARQFRQIIQNLGYITCCSALHILLHSLIILFRRQVSWEKLESSSFCCFKHESCSLCCFARCSSNPAGDRSDGGRCFYVKVSELTCMFWSLLLFLQSWFLGVLSKTTERNQRPCHAMILLLLLLRGAPHFIYYLYSLFCAVGFIFLIIFLDLGKKKKPLKGEMSRTWT